MDDSSYDSADDDEDGAVIEEEWSVATCRSRTWWPRHATAAAERLLRGRRAPDPAISALVPPGARRGADLESADAARERARLTPAALAAPPMRAAHARRRAAHRVWAPGGAAPGRRAATPRSP